MPTFHLGGEDARAFRLYLRSIQAAVSRASRSVMQAPHPGRADRAGRVTLGAKNRSRREQPWVMVGTKPGARLTDLQPIWQLVRAEPDSRTSGSMVCGAHSQSTALPSVKVTDDRQVACAYAGTDNGAICSI